MIKIELRVINYYFKALKFAGAWISSSSFAFSMYLSLYYPIGEKNRGFLGNTTIFER